MDFLPLPLHRAIIQRWVRDLEAYRVPERPPLSRAMQVMDHMYNRLHYRALGIMVNAAMDHSRCCRWRWGDQTVSIAFEQYDETPLHLMSLDGSVRYEECLPVEFRWLLGFSVKEEYRVVQWEYERTPFTEIAARLRRIYLPEGCEIADEETAWRIGVENFPEVEMTREWLRATSRESAWGREVLDGG